LKHRHCHASVSSNSLPLAISENHDLHGHTYPFPKFRGLILTSPQPIMTQIAINIPVSDAYVYCLCFPEVLDVYSCFYLFIHCFRFSHVGAAVVFTKKKREWVLLDMLAFRGESPRSDAYLTWNHSSCTSSKANA